MAWSAPMTAVAGGVVLAADFNQYVRDNLLATEAAAAANVGGFFVSTGSNAVTERVFTTATVDTNETTTSTTYTDLATVGPAVTVTTGTKALVISGGRIGANTNTAGAPSTKMSWAVSGATTVAASDNWAAGAVHASTDATRSEVYYTSRWWLIETLNAGSNTFTAKYAVSSGTGTYLFRSIHVLGL